jgi:saccharopine dehydrogenase-like NADP-dependent oxidoreductase
MKKYTVLCIGGTGDMGRHAARVLAKADFTHRLVLAGLDTPEGRAFATSLGSVAQFHAFDLNDNQALDRLMAGADIVVNTAGPFFRFGEKIAAAAISHKLPYIDICDDVEPTEALLKKHHQAKQAQTTMIVGMGLSPGVTNMLARMAAEALDAVDSIDTTWDLAATMTVDDGFQRTSSAEHETPAALVHWMHACSGEVRSLMDGQWIATRGVEPVELEIPGRTSITGWSVSHPETHTLPLRYPGLKSSRNFMTSQEMIFVLVRSLRDRIDSGQLSAEAAALELMKNQGFRMSMTLDQEQEMRARRVSQTPYLTAIARGQKNGKQATAFARLNRVPPYGMGANTGIPAAIGVAMLVEGVVARKGVLTPEQAFDPAEFFRRFEAYYPSSEADRPLFELDVIMQE